MARERFFADTNLFLRYLTNDIPEQADAAEGLFRRAAAGEITLVLNSMVIAEIVWVLESFYHLPRPEVEDKVLKILATPGLEIPDRDLIARAILWYAERNVDFIDAYNAAWMEAHHITTVCTFNQKHFARLPGITAIVPSG